jgi:hypothetical protein
VRIEIWWSRPVAWAFVVGGDSISRGRVPVRALQVSRCRAGARAPSGSRVRFRGSCFRFVPRRRRPGGCPSPLGNGVDKPAEMFDRDFEWTELTRFAALAGPQGKTFLLDAVARARGGFMFPSRTSPDRCGGSTPPPGDASCASPYRQGELPRTRALTALGLLMRSDRPDRCGPGSGPVRPPCRTPSPTVAPTRATGRTLRPDSPAGR